MRMIRLAATAVAVLALTQATPAQLIGTYTINKLLPTAGTNYDTLAAAVNALLTQGVSGPVTFEIFDDGGPFTESNPFTSANTGGGWAPSDAVLTLGVWTGASPANRVTFRAAPGEQPVFDATGRAMGVFWNGAQYVTLEGIEIANAIFDGVSLYTEAAYGQVLDAEILRCRIHDCGKVGVLVYGNAPNPLNTLIANNFFWNLQGSASSGSFGSFRAGYVSSRRHQGTRVVHNTFYVTSLVASTSAVITSEPSCGATATTCTDSYAEVSNNVFVKVAAASRPFFRYKDLGVVTGVPPIHESNCFFDTSAGPFGERVSATNTVSVDATLGDWQANQGADLGSILADPLLVDPANGDLHLQPGSPCQSASSLPVPVVTVDIDGDGRSAIADIGADEIVQGGALVVSVGSGCPGTGGLVPVLSGNGLPFLGNPNFSFDISQGLPNSQAYLFAAGATSMAGTGVGSGCRLHLSLPSLVGFLSAGIGPFGPLPTDGTGAASLPFPIPASPAVAGFTVSVQGVVIDPANSIGVTLTNALAIVVN